MDKLTNEQQRAEFANPLIAAYRCVHLLTNYASVLRDYRQERQIQISELTLLR